MRHVPLVTRSTAWVWRRATLGWLVGLGVSGCLSAAMLSDVPLAPRIVVDPQSQTVIEGNNVDLGVQATGTPPLQYQWQWIGVDRPGDTGSRLLIYQIRPDQAGAY